MKTVSIHSQSAHRPAPRSLARFAALVGLGVVLLPAARGAALEPLPAASGLIPPPMFGDWVCPDPLPYTDAGGTTTKKIIQPIPVDRGLYKIAENESPIPLDRVFASYNFYNHIAGDLDTLHRWGVGGEKTFLDGRASFGLRLPFYRFTMDEGGSKSGVGDLTMILKYALLDRPAGVLSAGLAVTAPTSDADIIWLPDGRRVHSTLWQPYVGYVWRREAWFVQGFSSVMLPADAADVKVLFNDVGVGRRFECDLGLLRAIVPAVEVHVNTPLNHRGGGSNPRFRDSVDVTGGMTFELGRRVSLGLAAATPVSHPRLFDLEAMVKLNVRF